MAIASAENLKQKLLQHLDNENNVVNEKGVLEAMTQWEVYPVTREILEVTRIGKYVNELRKKTTNKSLARRAKDLVRKWQSAPSSASLADGAGTKSGTVHTQPSAPSPKPSVALNGSVLERDELYSMSVTSSTDSLLKSKLKPSSSTTIKSSSSSPVTTRLERTAPDVREKSASNLLMIQHRGAATSYNHDNRSSVSPSLPGIELKSAFSSSGVAEDSQSIASSIASLTDAGSRSCSPAGFSSAVYRGGKQERLAALSSSQRKRLREEGGSSVEGGDVSARKKAKISATASPRRDTSSIQTHSNGEITGNGAFSKYTSDLSARTDNSESPSVRSKTVSSPAVAVNGHKPEHRQNHKYQPVDDNSNTSTSSAHNGMGGKAERDVLNGGHRSSSLSPMLQDRSSAAPRPTSSFKLRKVETTAELMNKLHASGELRLYRSETVERIASGQIAKEKDTVGGPVVPAGALPRPHKSSRAGKQSIESSSLNHCASPPATPAGGLAKVKTEMVHKFLQMSVPSTTLETLSGPGEACGAGRMDLTGLLSRLEEEPKPEEVVSFEAVTDKPRLAKSRMKNKQQQDAEGEHIKSTNENVSVIGLSAKNFLNRITGDEVSRQNIKLQHDNDLSEPAQPNFDGTEDLLPYYNPDDIDWSTTGGYDYVDPVDRQPITDDDIDRLHNDSIVGVNGYYDYRGEWKDWTATLSLPSYEGSLLHVLPYVNVDD